VQVALPCRMYGKWQSCQITEIQTCHCDTDERGRGLQYGSIGTILGLFSVCSSNIDSQEPAHHRLQHPRRHQRYVHVPRHELIRVVFNLLGVLTAVGVIGGSSSMPQASGFIMKFMFGSSSFPERSTDQCLCHFS
jgi:hypothetical protein